MKPVWTKRAVRRLSDAVIYIAQNFYPEYASAFQADVASTVEAICANPEIGVEAFPYLKRPEIRKLLCKNKKWFVYYRIKKDVCEVLSIRHALQDLADSLSGL